MNASLQILPPVMRGVNAAVLTPLNKDLSVDLGRMVAHCHWLLEHGCDGLGVLGTTGESTSFSARERMGILEGLAKAGIPMGKTMPGTGAAAFTDTVEITKFAMELGVGGVLMLPPFYYKNVTDDGVYNVFAEIIDRVASPRLRVYLYHFPQMSSTPISHDVIARLINHFPDVVVGIKDSSGEKQNMLDMLEKFPGFAVFPGSERIFLEVLQAGGAGCITAICNVASMLTQQVFSTWSERGEVDQGTHNQMLAVHGAISGYPLFAGLKALMADHSGDASWEIVRPPLCPLNEKDRAAIISELENTGYRIPQL